MTFPVFRSLYKSKLGIFKLELTCYLAAIYFKPQRYAIFPSQRFDSDKSSYQRFGENSKHNICGVGVSLKDLYGKRKNPLIIDFLD